MKRRQFIVGAGLTGVMPRVLRATTPLVPCPSPSAHAGSSAAVTTACTAVNAQTDWVNRISGPGVVWYNGFATEAEIDIFRWANGVGNDPTKKSPTAAALRLETGTGPGGFNCLAMDRAAGGTDTEVWWRPFSPMTAASNGKGVADPAAGGAIPLQVWDPSNVNELATWPHGFYGQGIASPDGLDFYIQVRVQVPPQPSFPDALPNCKLLEIGTPIRTLSGQNLVTVLNGSFGGTPQSNGALLNYHQMYVDGSANDYYPPDGSSQSFGDIAKADPRYPGLRAKQIGGDMSNYTTGAFCNADANSSTFPRSGPQYCWRYSWGWDTLLYHITPGPGPVSIAKSMCAIQVWGANPGQTTYRKILDQTYTLNNRSGGGSWSDVAGYGALYLTTYSNGAQGLVQPRAFTNRFAQVIFSKQFIPCPQI